MNHIPRFLHPSDVAGDLDAFCDWFGPWTKSEPDPMPHVTEIDTWYYGPRKGLSLCLSGVAATVDDMVGVLAAWERERVARMRAAEMETARAVEARAVQGVLL